MHFFREQLEKRSSRAVKRNPYAGGPRGTRGPRSRAGLHPDGPGVPPGPAAGPRAVPVYVCSNKLERIFSQL